MSDTPNHLAGHGTPRNMHPSAEQMKNNYRKYIVWTLAVVVAAVALLLACTEGCKRLDCSGLVPHGLRAIRSSNPFTGAHSTSREVVTTTVTFPNLLDGRGIVKTLTIAKPDAGPKYTMIPVSIIEGTTTLPFGNKLEIAKPKPPLYSPTPIPYFEGIKELKFSDHCMKRVKHNEVFPELSFMHFPHVYKTVNVRLPPFVEVHEDPEMQAVKSSGNHTALELLRKLKEAERHRDDQAILRRSIERSRDYMRSIWHPDNNQVGCQADFSIIWALYEIMFDMLEQGNVISNETQFFRLLSTKHTYKGH